VPGVDTVLTIYVGIDPGLSGAVAFIRGTEYRVADIPIIRKGEGFIKNEINASALRDILTDYLIGAKAIAALERVNAMPGQGVSSVFSLGDSFGACRAVLACADLATHYIAPAEWKRHFKLTSDKEEARALAVRLYPKAELHLKKHIDRAEALLIATYLKFKEEK